MSFRLLLVEDDVGIAEFLVQGLREEGYVVEHAGDGHAGERAIASGRWDLIILDWWLPGPDGFALLQTLRTACLTTPVLFLTARDDVPQRVQALNAGADDYVCKPFAFEELLARVQALIRRAASGTSPQWRFGDVLLDLSLNRVERGSHVVQLTAREQALLLFFLRHPDEVLSRSVLYEQVWQDIYDGLSNTLEVHVMELRRKLEMFGPRIIHTVRGSGYRLGDPAAGGEA